MATPKIRILCVGKSREPWLKTTLAHYAERSKPYLTLEWVEVDDEEALLRAARTGQPIALDPRGREQTSEEWCVSLYQELEARGEITLLIGGADGFSPALRALLPTQRMWSLSRLTMTHQVVRIMLAEQLYRAALIHIGHPYHRA
jgi:23S rRNA (pseudouridine1915-N3)-methyltransferase